MIAPDMLNWLLNALATRLKAHMAPLIEAEIEAQREADRKQVRELIAEMDDMLEKFSRMVARQAMRRTRETRAAAESLSEPDATGAGAAALPLRDRKAQLRARAFGGQLNGRHE